MKEKGKIEIQDVFSNIFKFLTDSLYTFVIDTLVSNREWDELAEHGEKIIGYLIWELNKYNRDFFKDFIIIKEIVNLLSKYPEYSKEILFKIIEGKEDDEICIGNICIFVDYDIQIKAAQCLIGICDVGDITRLLKAIDYVCRRNMMEIIDSFKENIDILKDGEGALTQFIQYVNEVKGQCNYYAMETIEKIANVKDIIPLFYVANRYHNQYLLNIVDNLIEMPEARDELLQALSDSNGEIRRGVLDILAWLVTLKSHEPYIDSSDDSWELVNSAIGFFNDGRFIKPIIKAFDLMENKDRNNDPNYFEYLLRNFGNNAVEPLIEALKSDDMEIKIGAVMALGKIGDKRAVESLKEVFDRNEEDLQVLIEKSLMQIIKKNK